MTNQSMSKKRVEPSSTLTQQASSKDSNNVPANKILSSWEKRSSHIPITNNWIKIDSARPQNENKEMKRENNTDNLKGSKEPTPEIQTERSNPEINEQDLSKTNNKTSTADLQIKHSIPEIDEQDLLKPPGETKSTALSIVEPILRNAYSNDIKAKSVKRNDQQHHTLADAIEWSTNNNGNPSAINLDTDTTAVGYKVYSSPSATQCSKLKVFRPKTANTISDHQKENLLKAERPKTANRLQRRSVRPLGEMELAIYWDVPPELETEIEPTEDKTIAIPIKNEISKLDLNNQNITSRSHSQLMTDQLSPEINNINSEANRTGDKISTDLAPELPKLEQLTEVHVSTISSPALSIQRIPTDTERRSISTSNKVKEPSKGIHVGVQVSKLDLRKAIRQCAAMYTKDTAEKSRSSTNTYKMAFKAGKLNNFNVDNALIDRLDKSRNLRVPRPKTPFAKKNYAIRTLMPPFSTWPQTSGQDYPDHWRLASVYQHAYRPLDARKSPFMRTVFQ